MKDTEGGSMLDLNKLYNMDSMSGEPYLDFIKTKRIKNIRSGFSVDRDMLNPHEFEWQKDIVNWALQKGRCALFEDCGLGKTLQQLDFSDQVCRRTGGSVLILAPLAVSNQTVMEGHKFGISVNLCESGQDVKAGINITNYEKLHLFNPSVFVGVVLDESSILKHQSSRTRQQLTDMFRDTPYKLCCTATPAPNDYMELGNHAEFLGIMGRSEMLSTFFGHDGGETQKWRIKGHAEDTFWEWVASWGAVVQNPSDLGHECEGYGLPPISITEHVIKSRDLESPDGQMILIPKATQTLNERRQSRRDSLEDRVIRAAEIANATDGQYLVWCDLNAEGEALEKAINEAVEVAGRHSDKHKTDTMMGFASGNVRVLVSKPGIAGWGMNWQNCHNVIFVGLSDSFESYYQAVRRCWRYGQKNSVNVHIITSEAEGAVVDNIKRKQRNAQKMTDEIANHTRKILYKEIYGTTEISASYLAHEKMILPPFLERTAM